MGHIILAVFGPVYIVPVLSISTLFMPHKYYWIVGKLSAGVKPIMFVLYILATCVNGPQYITIYNTSDPMYCNCVEGITWSRETANVSKRSLKCCGRWLPSDISDVRRAGPSKISSYVKEASKCQWLIHLLSLPVTSSNKINYADRT